jgi:inorganic pyrophosphatase
MNITRYLGQKVNVIIDRPLGSKHPEHGFIYEVNYGYVPDTKSKDGEEIDVYVLGVNKAIEKTTGVCIAIIKRTDDDDDKLVVTPNGESISDKEINKLIKFQEKWFKHTILRNTALLQ